MSLVAKRGILWSRSGPCAAISLATVLVAVPVTGSAEIIWKGDYETGSFLQWHLESEKNTPKYAPIPPYGRPRAPSPFFGIKPLSYYGDGSLLQLVTSPVRQGRYAARFVVKNSAHGNEPADCDGGWESGNANCYRRRTELTTQQTHPVYYNAMPYMSERWMSVSHYIPSDWDTTNGSGFGPVVFQVKPYNETGLSPCFSILIAKPMSGKPASWVISHLTSEVANPSRDDIPPQNIAKYDPYYPAPDGSGNGADLRADFPNQAVSQAALADLNKGDWTDWVMRIRFDARGSKSNGTGLLDVWKRAGSGSWVHVLHLTPRLIARGDQMVDRGICYNSPANGTNPGGFGIKAGLYMDKNQVWNLKSDRVIYNDNIKVGDAKTVFADMVPDITSQLPPPVPPYAVTVE